MLELQKISALFRSTKGYQQIGKIMSRLDKNVESQYFLQNQQWVAQLVMQQTENPERTVFIDREDR